MIPKPERTTDEEYLGYIQQQDCLVCGDISESHHLITRRTGGSDYTAVNLCREHHTEIGMGIEKFQKKYKLNVWKDAHRLFERYTNDRIGELIELFA